MAEKKKTILTEDMLFYKYIIKEFNITIPGEAKPIKVLPMQIESFFIERNYFEEYFPIFSIRLRLPAPVLFKVVENKTKVNFQVRLQKKPMDINKKVANMPPKDVFNKKFAIYIDDNNPFFTEKEFKTSHGAGPTKALADQSFTPKDYAMPIDFYLFPEKELLGSKKIVNLIFGAVNMTDAVAYTIGSGGINNVIMGKMDNNETYGQVILPALNVIDTIEYLEEVYGFYNDGSLLFFDLDRNYLIPSNEKCVAWAPQEYKETVIVSKNRNNQSKIQTGSLDYKKEKKFLINIDSEMIEVKNRSGSNDQIIGSNITTIDTRKDNKVDAKVEAEKRGTGSSKMIYNKYSNKFTQKAMVRQRNAENIKINITANNFDIDIFKPNKSFKFIFEDGSPNKKLGGAYQLESQILTFTRSEGHDYSVKAAIVFKK